MDVTLAVEVGRKAYERGKHKGENPFKRTTQSYALWAFGWEKAKAEEIEKRQQNQKGAETYGTRKRFARARS